MTLVQTNRTTLVIFTVTPMGPYQSTQDIEFNHADQTCTFRNIKTKQKETIGIDEIEYITFQESQLEQLN